MEDKLVNDVGWGLLFLWSGIVLVVPGISSAWGLWLVGVGAILLGLNAARYMRHIEPRLFWVGVGVIALVAGIGSFLSVDVPIIALGLLLCGVLVLLKPFTERSRLSYTSPRP